MSLHSNQPEGLQRTAYSAFSKAIEIVRSDAATVSNAAWAAASFGDLPEALLPTNAAIDLAPPNATYRLRQAWVLKRQGADAEVRQATSDALRLQPGTLEEPPTYTWERDMVRELVNWPSHTAR